MPQLPVLNNPTACWYCRQQSPCVDCLSTGQLCYLCGKPAAGDDCCECPPFDREESKARK